MLSTPVGIAVGLSGGAASLDVDLPATLDITAFEIDPSDAEVIFELDSDGWIYTTEGTPGTPRVQHSRWLVSGTNADFEARVTKVSGTNLSGSALATWLAMTSDLSWSHTRTGIGTTSSANTVEIRDKVTLAVLATMNSGGLTMDATVEV